MFGTLRAVGRAAAALLLACGAAAGSEPAQTALHVLDYVAVDYAGAVAGGKVIDEAEFAEMREFTADTIERIKVLPANARREALLTQAVALARAVEARADAHTVAQAARELRSAIIDAYGVRTAPADPPDPALGRRIYAGHCAACHGSDGRGDGPAAAGLDPAPSNFHDAGRMAQRSLYALYSTVTLGVQGTSMPAFERLSEHERWSVAAFVARFAAARPSSLDRASRLLADAVAASKTGEAGKAHSLAIQAYLDGFEPVEAALATVDRALVRAIESQMMALPAALKQGADAQDIERRATAIEAQLAQARALLGAEGLAPATTFASSFLILLREGLEAIVVLAAIIAFVKKAGRRDALRYVHAGWVGAVALGLLTWAAATYLVDISGAGREIAEGVTALVAAATLVYVGYWLHDKSHAHAWRAFIEAQVGGALARRAWWAMAAAAFLAVYREMFEIVLFCQALWTQAAAHARGAFFGGLLTAAAALAAIAWLVFRCGVRLPIGAFFSVMSILVGALAVVIAGQGVAALQDAGVVSVTPVAFVALPAIGVFPTVQTLAVQLVMVLIVAASFYVGGRRRIPRSERAT